MLKAKRSDKISFKAPQNLKEFIAILRRHDLVADIYAEVDPTLEIAEIHRRVIDEGGPALLFHNVKGSSFPVITNLFGTEERVRLAFQNRPEETVAELIQWLTRDFPPKVSDLWQKRHLWPRLLKLGTKKSAAPVLEKQMKCPDLHQLPLLKSWPMDGGHFITLPLVYTEPPHSGPPNLGMYRIQRHSATQTGLHWQIAKGGGFHHHHAEQLNRPLPVSIFLGGPPALILSAITPLPENVSELLFCSFLLGNKLATAALPHHPHPILAECEFALLGSCPAHTRKLEGPFGDHYGYYSLAHDFPVFECSHIYHRRDAIYPATIVGKPRQEDFFLGDFCQKLLAPLFPLVMPGVKALWSFGETGFHSLAGAVVQERYSRECISTAFRILGEGQLALTKFLLLTDQPIDPSNFPLLLTTILERCNFQTDLYIFANLSLDTLDYTGPALNKGSRGILLGIGEKKRDLPTAFSAPLPPEIRAAKAHSPGCLVLEPAVTFTSETIPTLLQHPSLQKWPLVILVSDLAAALKSPATFLWTVFTRFEPAADIHAKNSHTFRHHLCYQAPLLIDARMKPSYPPELICDDETAARVSRRWKSYFSR